MKPEQTTSRQITAHIFARCFALAPGMALLASFAAQILLAVLLCQYASTDGEVLGNMAVLVTGSGPYTNILVGEIEGTTDVSSHYLQVLPSARLYCFKHVSSQAT